MFEIAEKMSEKERLFCMFYSRTRSVREAAARAGYRVLPELKGLRLMQREDIMREIDSQTHKLKTENNVRAGLERLSFGSVSDAVRLLYEKEVTPEMLENMDLFQVSEIKRGVNGVLEMKFFNRLQALEKLSALEEQADNSSSFAPFYEALEKGAKALYGKR